jgi:addiction module RelE/StbE family toxin
VKVTFSAEAEDQFREIQAAFRDVSRELASRFAEEVGSAVWRIEHFPLSGQDFDGVRRVVLHRSRYLMLYMVRNDRVHVTKLVHQKENREY